MKNEIKRKQKRDPNKVPPGPKRDESCRSSRCEFRLGRKSTAKDVRGNIEHVVWWVGSSSRRQLKGGCLLPACPPACCEPNSCPVSRVPTSRGLFRIFHSFARVSCRAISLPAFLLTRTEENVVRTAAGFKGLPLHRPAAPGHRHPRGVSFARTTAQRCMSIQLIWNWCCLLVFGEDFSVIYTRIFRGGSWFEMQGVE